MSDEQGLTPYESREILFYRTDNGDVRVEILLYQENLWLTQAKMAELFDVQKAAVSKHLKNIFEEGELDKSATVSKMETVQNEGGRMVRRTSEFYNLDAIIAVGTEDDLLQKIYPDIVRGAAGTAIALVVGAVEILDLRVALIEMKVQIVSAVGADKHPGEHTNFAVICFAFAELSTLFLHLLPHGTVNDRRMHILEHYPIFTVIVYPLFELIGLGVGFEIEDVAAVFLQCENMSDG